MTDFKIKKGLDIPLEGRADTDMVDVPYPKLVALYPSEFHINRPKFFVKEGAAVRAGTPLFYFKHAPDVKYVSPVSGTLSKIHYGEQRKVLAVEIMTDEKKECESFGPKTSADLQKMNREDVVRFLKDSGLLMFLRERPFDRVPTCARLPKSIFVNTMNTEPNAADQGWVLKDSLGDLQLGVDLLKKLTDGKIHVCISANNPNSKVFSSLKNVENHTFSGPHPAGLVSTHIHRVDPINKGECVWYLKAMHLANLGKSLRLGYFCAQWVVALCGTGVKDGERKYYRTYLGAKAGDIVKKRIREGHQRVISGTVLSGRNIGLDGFLNFYETTISVIHEGNYREFMGWALPGIQQYSASSRVFLSSIISKSKRFDLNTNKHGGHRTIVWTDVYDNVVPLDIYTNFLVKAILAGDIEEAEQLGILEVAPEDFALATFICPSKTEVSDIIREGLETIEKEGD